ncbi:AMP-binding protein [uncultured Microbulbifer sp.]|uniref:AMP-binding protein n=1 Tax=uncultured Microbulbifer sp. TaxID=348147 RepID=UPI0025D5B9CC|nr:AMP-binding protein [uncultured Microbulbifer sp.]
MQWQQVFGYRDDDALLCIAADGSRINFKTFKRDLACACTRLQALDIRDPRAVAALYCSDSYAFCVWFFAALARNFKLVIPANNKRSTVNALGDVQVWLGEWPQAAAGQAVHLQFRPADSSAISAEPPERFTGELQLFTSGSSGEPQRIDKTLVQLLAELAAQQRQWGEQIGDARVLATVSHQHIYGLLFKLLWPLHSGRAFVSRTYVDVAALLRDAEQFTPAIWVASPAQLSRRNLSWPWASGQSLAAIFSSGGPLAAEDAAAIAELSGHWPTEIYGSTETGGIAWRSQRDGNVQWTPLSGVALRLSDTNLLQVRSPWIAGEFASQDRARIQGERFELQGRADQIAKIEEKRISLTQVERLLQDNPCIHQARVLVLPKGARRTRDLLGAVVVPTDSGRAQLQNRGKSALVRDLRQWLAPDLEGVALPRSWRFVSAMPVNQQGKSPRELLMQQFDSNLDTDGRDTPQAMLPQVTASRLLDGDDASVQRARVSLRIPGDLPCLPGHFADAPVVPGVVQIDWAVHFARQLLQVPGEFSGMENIKFKQLLVPQEQAELELAFDRDKQRLSYRFFWQADEFSSGRVSFRHD